ncbi:MULTISPECIES: hypothetical protein [Hyphobacterium]|uniref:Uncharacterized protein n=1 Tax=Hyphobacterium vulgare TaxID=1736751 RepID=A0ABV7A096_9PROT
MIVLAAFALQLVADPPRTLASALAGSGEAYILNVPQTRLLSQGHGRIELEDRVIAIFRDRPNPNDSDTFCRADVEISGSGITRTARAFQNSLNRVERVEHQGQVFLIVVNSIAGSGGFYYDPSAGELRPGSCQYLVVPETGGDRPRIDFLDIPADSRRAHWRSLFDIEIVVTGRWSQATPYRLEIAFDGRENFDIFDDADDESAFECFDNQGFRYCFFKSIHRTYQMIGMRFSDSVRFIVVRYDL